jgi:membrane protein implicated in regulation of membrane protease activity
MDLSPAMIWIAVGLVLLIIEVFTLSFVVLFFGIAALAVALFKFTTNTNNLALELVIFAVLGVSCLLGFRNKLRQTFNKGARVNTDASTIIDLSESVAPHKNAKIEYQGTLWDAYNDSDLHLKAGEKAIIVRTDGIKLIIKPYRL